jgi:hypothetical protein
MISAATLQVPADHACFWKLNRQRVANPLTRHNSRATFRDGYE